MTVEESSSVYIIYDLHIMSSLLFNMHDSDILDWPFSVVAVQGNVRRQHLHTMLRQVRYTIGSWKSLQQLAQYSESEIGRHQCRGTVVIKGVSAIRVVNGEVVVEFQDGF